MCRDKNLGRWPAVSAGVPPLAPTLQSHLRHLSSPVRCLTGPKWGAATTPDTGDATDSFAQGLGRAPATDAKTRLPRSWRAVCSWRYQGALRRAHACTRTRLTQCTPHTQHNTHMHTPHTQYTPHMHTQRTPHTHTIHTTHAHTHCTQHTAPHCTPHTHTQYTPHMHVPHTHVHTHHTLTHHSAPHPYHTQHTTHTHRIHSTHPRTTCTHTHHRRILYTRTHHPSRADGNSAVLGSRLRSSVIRARRSLSWEALGTPGARGRRARAVCLDDSDWTGGRACVLGTCAFEKQRPGHCRSSLSISAPPSPAQERGPELRCRPRPSSPDAGAAAPPAPEPRGAERALSFSSPRNVTLVTEAALWAA